MIKRIEKIIMKLKRFWKYQRVEHMYCSAFPKGEPVMKKSIAKGLAIATQLFALAAAVCSLSFMLFNSDKTGATLSDWIQVIKVIFSTYSMVLLTPRVLLMIPAVINMYAFKPKRFYVVMIGISLISIAVFKI
jgi:hypothetical protein